MFGSKINTHKHFDEADKVSCNLRLVNAVAEMPNEPEDICEFMAGERSN